MNKVPVGVFFPSRFFNLWAFFFFTEPSITFHQRTPFLILSLPSSGWAPLQNQVLQFPTRRGLFSHIHLSLFSSAS